MENKFKFEIESLLVGIENRRGPIEQVLFAMRYAQNEGWEARVDIARVTFADPSINKEYPGGTRLDETLLIAYELKDIELHLCVRSGKSCLKVATGYFPTKEMVVHKQYRHEILHRKLTDKQIEEIFNYAWGHYDDVIRAQPGYLEP